MEGFSELERAAIAERAAELRATKGLKGAAKRARDYEACIDAIDSLDGLDHLIAARLHTIVAEEAPELDAKTWYGFPSYAYRDSVIVFFQPASKFNSRYGTVGFNESATLDEASMWPTSFAVVEMNDEVEQKLRKLVSRAVSGLLDS